MKIVFLSLFPKQIETCLDTSILARAQKSSIVEFRTINPRDFAEGKNKSVDDRPFGGGCGMVLRADVLARAWEHARVGLGTHTKVHTILLSPQGTRLSVPWIRKWEKSVKKANWGWILVCGHYEGIDQRFIDQYVDEEISIGDYVLTGGELPALVLTDALVRRLPGVLSSAESVITDSHENKKLKYPQYTKPRVFEGHAIPEVLLSGNHKEIIRWREMQSMEVTQKKRPDLLKVKLKA